MSRTIMTLLAAGFLAAACHRSPEKAAIADNAALLQRSLEQQADNMEALAAGEDDPNAAAALRNTADQLEADKHEIAKAARVAKREAH